MIFVNPWYDFLEHKVKIVSDNLIIKVWFEIELHIRQNFSTIHLDWLPVDKEVHVRREIHLELDEKAVINDIKDMLREIFVEELHNHIKLDAHLVSIEYKSGSSFVLEART